MSFQTVRSGRYVDRSASFSLSDYLHSKRVQRQAYGGYNDGGATYGVGAAAPPQCGKTSKVQNFHI